MTHLIRQMGYVAIATPDPEGSARDLADMTGVRVTHRSLFDGSIQGLERTDAPAFCFQGHPEASPGPHDILPLFDRFMRLMESRAAVPAVAETATASRASL